MKKIIFVCVIIIILVISSDILLKRKIFSDFDYIISELEKIDTLEDNQLITNEIELLNKYIEKRDLLLAFYIDHGEMETIKTQMVIIKAGSEVKDEQFLHEEIQKTIFVIKHLKGKIEFKIENIL